MSNPQHHHVYVAGPFGRQHDLKLISDRLSKLGFTMTSRWVHFEGAEVKGNPELAAKWAKIDLQDLADADILIIFPSAEHGTGHHVEFGYALASGHRIIVIGERPGIFYYLPEVEHYETLEAFLAEFAKESDD